MAHEVLLAGTALTPPAIAGRPGTPVFKIGSEEAEKRPDDQCRSIIDRLAKLAQEQVAAKGPIEERWIRDTRAYYGYYDTTTEKNLKDARQSRAYVKVTRAKTVALEARLFDMIHPTDDRNWGIGATPVPRLAKEATEAEQRAKNAATQANEAEAAGANEIAGQIIAEGRDEIGRKHAAEAEIARATKSAEQMQEEMDDQLIESRYPIHSRDCIRQACRIGTGVLKGPMVGERTRGKWVPQEGAEGQFVLEEREDPRPLVRYVDAWSFFPDMSARTIEEAEFTFERHLWSKQDLRRMVKTHGFDPDAVRELLREGRKSPLTSPSLNYLTQLRSITGETDGTIKNRWIGWEYHGPLECEDVVTLLRALGREGEAEEYEQADDPLNEFRVLLYFCDDVLLKIAPEYPLDSGETLYSVFNVEEDDSSIFGYGIPHIMGDSQSALNSAWRQGLDNSGLSVGPQVVIDKDSIQPANGSWTMTPKKVWWRVKAAVPNSGDPVNFFNVPNNMKEIAEIIKIALEFIDMETGIPMPQQGEQGAHTTQTVGGMAILQNAANVIFRRMVKNYDDGIISPTMRRLYDWNMQFNPRTDIKGDMTIDARGTSVLLVKEIAAQNLMFVVTNLLTNETTAPMLKPYAAVVKLFQSMMIKPDEVMTTEDEWKENVKKIAEASAGQQDPATIQAQARVEAANILAQSQEMRAKVQREIAEIKERTSMMELASNHNLTLEQLKTRLAEKQIDQDGQDRRLAAEVGVEERMAAAARARGEEPQGSGGSFSAGGTPEKAEAA